MNLDVNIKTYIILFLLVFAIPILVTAPITLLTYSMKAKYILFGVLGFIFVIYIGLCFSISNNEIKINNGELKVKAAFYQYSISINKAKDNFKIYDEIPSDLNIVYRSNGIATSGYKIGWFELANGSKSFVVLIGENKKFTVINTNNEYFIINRDLTDLLIN